MLALTADEMRAIDQYTIKQLEIPSLVLMENAALRTISQINLDQRQSFAIFCGTGNNGGDGLAIARGLHSLGKTVIIFIVGNPKKTSPEFGTQLRALSHLNVEISWLDTLESIQDMQNKLKKVNTLIDCIFGTGLSSAVRPPHSVVIDQVNQSRIYTISVDIPSGIDTDTGRVMGTAVQADLVICLEFMKQGLVDNPYVRADIRVVPIGIPREAKIAILGEREDLC